MTAPTVRRVAILQARMSSTRLPGKVLADLDGLPLIVFMARRVLRARRLDALVVATSEDPSDDVLAQTLATHGLACHRGSLNDVLDRFVHAARQEQATHVVRLTGDCPLMDPDLIDQALDRLTGEGLDYVSNCVPPTYPDGLDVECCTMAALELAWREATLPSEREHVTPYLRRADRPFRQGLVSGVADLSALRWTVDHPDDLAHVRQLVQAARAAGQTDFDRFDLYRLIERGAVGAGAGHGRNEGYQTSLDSDPGHAPAG